MKTKFGVIGIVLLLASCTGINSGAGALNNYVAANAAAVDKNIQGANDNAVAIWAAAGCGIPYGAVVRNASTIPGLANAVEKLCGVLPLANSPTALGSSINSEPIR